MRDSKVTSAMKPLLSHLPRLMLASLALVTAASRADSSADMRDVVMRTFSAQVAGKTLRYVSEADRIAIADVDTGTPHGYMFYTAYRVTDTGKTRPVAFVWNGGPGADSSLLHFSAGGPKRVEKAGLVDNGETWLTDTDLVFVDPIGTGFSRPTRPEYGEEFYNTRGDVLSVAEFVRSWRVLHGADTAPTYLVGESWGARRAASVAYALQARHVRVDGIVLISGGWGLNHEYVDAPLRTALTAVDMATTALYYGKSALNAGTSVGVVRDTVGQWARNTYAPALAREKSLSDAERQAIANQLAAYIGVPANIIDPHKLAVSPREFRRALLADRKQEPYIFDMRRTDEPGHEGTQAILHYFRHDLGYVTSQPYVGVEEPADGYAPGGVYSAPVGERWDYATEKLSPERVQAAIAEATASGAGPPQLGAPLPATEDALAQNPSLRVLVAGGLYDSFLPCALGEETERKLPTKLASAIQFKCYFGGHAMYLDPATRQELARDLRRFVTGGVLPK
jgi:carboxypeptidase C (cathepsin A)